MPTTNSLSELLATLFEQSPFSRKLEDSRSVTDLCHALLEDVTEVSGLRLATTILSRYRQMSDDEKIAFFTYLNDVFDLNPEQVSKLAAAYAKDPSPKNYLALSQSAEPPRQELLRRLNQVPGATGELVRMRKELLAFLTDLPVLTRTDLDFVHLLKSWFNRGFLVLRQINWNSPASILERLISYEAVHEIQSWEDLRRRLSPDDRRCFAFFHPSMPDDPLIFVEVALTSDIPGAIHDVLADERKILEDSEINTAVFYSISNCQDGLAGISFGNSLIKQVARDLSRDLPSVKTFVTLSPIPGLSRWLQQEGLSAAAQNQETLKKLAASYLFEAKNKNEKPRDPVARFHLGNGALIEDIHLDADRSSKGMAQSLGVMVNYRYDLNRIPQNLVSFLEKNKVVASASVRSLVNQAKRIERPERPSLIENKQSK